MRRQPSSLKLKDPGKRISSTSASQIQTFVPERADTFEHERKKKKPFLLSLGVLYSVLITPYEYILYSTLVLKQTKGARPVEVVQ